MGNFASFIHLHDQIEKFTSNEGQRGGVRNETNLMWSKNEDSMEVMTPALRLPR